MVINFRIERRLLIVVTFGLLCVSDSWAVSPPNQRPQHASGSGLPVAIIPFSIVDGRILFEAKLDGRGPFRMIFDSGASAVLSRDVAKSLRLSLSQTHSESGTGDQASELDSAKFSDRVTFDQV